MQFLFLFIFLITKASSPNHCCEEKCVDPRHFGFIPIDQPPKTEKNKK